jgi:hypothetical protein
MQISSWRSSAFAVPFLIAFVFTYPASAQFYKQVNLVSDISGMAAITDPLLVNPWGVSHGPMTPFWVSDQVCLSNILSIHGITNLASRR